MLYDVLPPITLVASLGGIILIVSRVSMRVRREELSEHIQSTAANGGAAIQPDRLFRPGARKFQLVKNRLALIPQTMKQSMQNMREGVRERKETAESRLEEKQRAKQQRIQEKEERAQERRQQKEQKRVQMPHVAWRERVSSLAEKSKQKVSTIQESVREAARKAKEDVPMPEAAEKSAAQGVSTDKKSKRPARLRLVRTTDAEEDAQMGQNKPRTIDTTKTQSMISSILKKEKKEQQTPLEQAEVCIRDKRFEQAEDILLPHIMEHTHDTEAYMMLGRAAMGLSAWSEAIEIFKQVEKIKPDEPGLYAALGHAAMQAGKMTMAMEALQRARDMDSQNVEVREELLTLARRMDNKIVERSVREELEEIQAAKEAKQKQQETLKQSIPTV